MGFTEKDSGVRHVQVARFELVDDDPHKLLLAAVITQAVNDWRALIEKKAWIEKKPVMYGNFDELRGFFESEWFDCIMQCFNTDAQSVLSQMEKELQEAMQRHARAKRKGAKNERNRNSDRNNHKKSK